jgi:hypothetical protein
MYLKSHQLANDAGIRQLSARVMIFLAMEEVRAGLNIVSPAIEAALADAERGNDPVLKVLAHRTRQLALPPK